MTTVNEIKKDWNDFVKAFWVIFVMKVVYLSFFQNITQNSPFALDLDTSVSLIILQLIPIFLMVYLMGRYAYEFSGKKHYWLFGLAGSFWFGLIGIFIGYFLIRMIKNKAIRKAEIGKPSQGKIISHQRYCSQCGQQVFLEDKFCGNCGYALEKLSNTSIEVIKNEDGRNNDETDPRKSVEQNDAISVESTLKSKKKFKAEGYIFYLSIITMIIGMVSRSETLGWLGFFGIILFSAIILLKK